MRVRKIKPWSWKDYRYPTALAAALMSLTALLGVIGLFQSNTDRGSQIVELTSDSSCRAGIASKVDVALLDAFDFVLKAPPRGTPEEVAARAQLIGDIEAARAERAATNVRCHATATTVTILPTKASDTP